MLKVESGRVQARPTQAPTFTVWNSHQTSSPSSTRKTTHHGTSILPSAMEPSLASVSSLYGPGTFGGWMCTTASVFISWTCHRHSMSHDTIGNDFIAVLIFPIVAAIHHRVELSKSGKEDAELATETLSATLCVVMWFSEGIGSWMLCFTLLRGWPRRFFCVLVSGSICISVFVALSKNDAIREVLPSLAATTVFATIYCASAFAMAPIISNVVLHSSPMKSFWGRLIHFLKTSFRSSKIAGIMYMLWGVMWLWRAVNSSVEVGRLQRAGKAHPILVPETPYSITELDQAMALSAGLMTLFFSIYEAIISWRRPKREGSTELKT